MFFLEKCTHTYTLSACQTQPMLLDNTRTFSWDRAARGRVHAVYMLKMKIAIIYVLLKLDWHCEFWKSVCRGLGKVENVDKGDARNQSACSLRALIPRHRGTTSTMLVQRIIEV